MLRRVDLRGGGEAGDLAAALPRAALDVDAAVALVRPVVDDVRTRGDAAVLAATERFDGVTPPALRVPAEALAEALTALPADVRAALEEGANRVRIAATAALPHDSAGDVVPGGHVRERWVPVRRVGLYVPAGRVPLPSSVVMNVVPAQVAGVESLAVASPPQVSPKDVARSSATSGGASGYDFGGMPHPVVLGACALLGVDEVYAVGGAQAIAMLALGTETCPAVDVVTGPGNVYVAAAKRIVRGIVGTDGEAGPTEVCVLADASADPAAVAADLISQAEHDVLAAALLVTDSVELADAVQVELDKQVPAAPNRETVEAALAGQSAIVLVDSIDAGLVVADAWAAEHLEVITHDAEAVAARVRNAGAIFVGPWSPVSLGDYLAGSNHVLPTGGTARFAGGLSPVSFLRQQHIVTFDRAALTDAAPHVRALAGAESLAAHAEAVDVRVRDTAP